MLRQWWTIGTGSRPIPNINDKGAMFIKLVSLFLSKPGLYIKFMVTTLYSKLLVYISSNTSILGNVKYIFTNIAEDIGSIIPWQFY